jgi:hypothetical protein
VSRGLTPALVPASSRPAAYPPLASATTVETPWTHCLHP